MGRFTEAGVFSWSMSENRVVEGRMVTDCGGSVISVGYMPSVTEFVTGYKCQDCAWSETDRD